MPKRYAAIAKITMPDTSGVLRRKRLFHLLDEGRKRPVTWICGPPGSGKSTLVSSYIASRKLPCLWYQVDEGDADISTFFYYMGIAAKRAAPRSKKSLPLLTPEYLAGIPTFTKRYFEELYGRLMRTGGVIVLDNYQEAPSASQFHDMLANGFAVVPHGVNIIVISRGEPPQQLARQRANGKISMIGWNDVRFTLEEADSLIRLQSVDKTLVSASANIHERSDGWAAGIVLLMKDRRRNRTDLHAAGREITQDVFDYFANELIRTADPETQRFLWTTSFLPFLTVGMASQLTGIPEAGEILSKLTRGHYFIDWHPEPTPVYQYHPLFREFLQTQAKNSYAPGELAQIQRQAADLLEEAGFNEEAVELFCALSDFDRAAPLVLRNAWTLLAQGRSKTIELWLSRFPDTTLASEPYLLQIAGLCRLPFNLSEALAHLENSFRLLDKKKDYATAIQVCGCILEAIVIAGDTFEAIDHYIHWLNSITKKREPLIRDMAGKAAGTVLFALALRDMNQPMLHFWLKKAEAAVIKTADIATTFKLCNHLMAYYIYRGEFSKITLLMKIMSPFRKEAEAVPALQSLCLLFEACHAVYVLAEVEHGISYAQKGLDIAQAAGIKAYNFWFYYLIVNASITTGDMKTGGACLDRMREEWRAAPAYRTGELHSLSGALAMGSGEWQTAVEYFHLAVEIFERAGSCFSTALSRIALSQACFLSGDERSARQQLQAAAQGKWANSWLTAYQGLVTQAYLDIKNSKLKNGHAALCDGFKIARKHCLRILPSWNRAVSAFLCAEALNAGVETEFVQELIRKHRLSPLPGEAFLTDAWPWPVRIYTLGRFEVLLDGKPLLFEGKVQKKPLELLKALISLGCKDIPEERIMDALWPEADGAAAHAVFKAALYRLRQGLGDERYILLKNGRLSLSEEDCWVDALAFLRAASAVREGAGEEAERLSEKAIQYYRGTFLPDDSIHGWSTSMRERIRRSFVNLADMAAGRLAQHGSLAEAARLYEKAVETGELDEDVYSRLMECYAWMGRKDKVAKTYNRCCNALMSRLEIEPSEDIQEQYKRFMAS